jgi:hypothetical protein
LPEVQERLMVEVVVVPVVGVVGGLLVPVVATALLTLEVAVSTSLPFLAITEN